MFYFCNSTRQKPGRINFLLSFMRRRSSLLDKTFYRLRFTWCILCFICLSSLWAQVDSLPAPPRLTAAQRDSLAATQVRADTTRPFKLSKDSIDAPVKYTSRDSQVVDYRAKLAHLYGEAKIEYTDITLEADYIRYDIDGKTVFASAWKDSTGALTKTGQPKFTQAKETFDCDSLKYNFATGKAIVYNLSSVYDGMHVHGEKTMLIRDTSVAASDTSAARNIIYNQSAIISSCDLPEPHFGIRSNRQKLIPNKQVIIGPSTLEIQGVPVFWLPFGFFPVTQTRRAGLIIPKDYDFSPNFGFGIRDIGYFTPIGEHFNVNATFDIYTRGSWGMNLTSDYNKKYKYSGNLQFSYDKRVEERIVKLPGTDVDQVTNIPATSIGIRWSHNQASTAHPYQRFSGSVNINTNGQVNRLVDNSATNQFNSNLTSQISFSRSFPGLPISINGSVNHNQNVNTGLVNMSLPRFALNMQRIYPFKNKRRSGPERFYEKINLKYDLDLQNNIRTKDSLLFTSAMFDDSQYGIQHRINASTDFKLARYFNFSPAFDFTEVWNFQTINYRQDTANVVKRDTIQEFKPVHLYNFSMGFNTTLYGTMRFKKGLLRGLRHTMRPSVSLAYTPNYVSPELKYFQEIGGVYYNRLANSLYAKPSESGQNFGLNFSLNNNLEAKYYSKKDTTEKILKVFENFSLSTNYNFLADTLKWQPISGFGSTRFFNGLTTLGINIALDPYDKVNGRRVNTWYVRSHKAPLRLERLQFNLNSRLSYREILDFFQGKKKAEAAEEEDEVDADEVSKPQNQGPAEEYFYDLFRSFSISHDMAFGLNTTGSGQSFGITTNSIYINGDIPLTQKWSIRLGSIGYDFVNKDLTYPDLGITRDLHCWTMVLSTQPQRGTFTFTIQVKDPKLNFLKVPYAKGNYDVFR